MEQIIIIRIVIIMLITNILYIGLVASDSVQRVKPYEGNGLNGIYNNPNKVVQDSSINANFPDDYGNVQIYKYVTPKFQDFYIENQVYIVHVKISGIGRSLDNISVKEEVPSALQIRSFRTYPTIFDPFDNSSVHNISLIDSENTTSPMSSWKENYSSNSNNIMIKVGRLKPKRCIEYEYELIPRRTGTYSDTTVVRIGGETSKFPDVENRLEFDVRDPLFEIVLSKVDSYGYINEPLNVTYNIIHVSGSCSGPILLNISFNNTTKYNISWNERSIELTPFKSRSINVSIYYMETGGQSFPPIIINNKANPSEMKDIIIYSNCLFKYADDSQNIFNSTQFFIALYAILIYFLHRINTMIKKLTEVTLDSENKIDNDLKKLTEIDNDLKKLTEVAARSEKEIDNGHKKATYYEYIEYQNAPFSGGKISNTK